MRLPSDLLESSSWDEIENRILGHGSLGVKFAGLRFVREDFQAPLREGERSRHNWMAAFPTWWSPFIGETTFYQRTQPLGCPNLIARSILWPATVLGSTFDSLRCIPALDHSAKEVNGHLVK